MLTLSHTWTAPCWISPHVVAGLQGSKNLNYFAGDMLEAVPLADAILLKVCLSFSYQLLTFSGSQRMRKIFFKYVKNHFRKESQFEKNFQYFFFLLFYVRFKKQNQFVFLVRKLWFKYTKHYGSKGVPYEKESQFMVNKRKYWGKWDQTPKLHWPYLLFIHHVPFIVGFIHPYLIKMYFKQMTSSGYCMTGAM